LESGNLKGGQDAENSNIGLDRDRKRLCKQRARENRKT
jgi:hypothetical protein